MNFFSRYEAQLAGGVWVLVVVTAGGLIWSVWRGSDISSTPIIRPPADTSASPSSVPLAAVTIGAVDVTVTRVQTVGNQIELDLSLNTHSVAVDTYMADRLMTLRGRDGVDVTGEIMVRTGTNHHQEMTLRFPAVAAPSALIIRNLDQVPLTTLPINL